MFKKPFNKVTGEERQCKKCGDTYHTMKPRWICTKCVNANQKPIETKKRVLKGYKQQYPFDNKNNEAGARFHKIQKALREAWKEYNKTGDKSVIVAHYDKQLKEIEENGIMTWIFDRRDDASKKENKLKTASMTRKEYPDTRGHYED